MVVVQLLNWQPSPTVLTGVVVSKTHVRLRELDSVLDHPNTSSKNGNSGDLDSEVLGIHSDDHTKGRLQFRKGLERLTIDMCQHLIVLGQDFDLPAEHTGGRFLPIDDLVGLVHLIQNQRFREHIPRP